MSTSKETKAGYAVEAALCKFVGGKRNAPCDIHIDGRGFEIWLSWNGKNGANLREDLRRAKAHGGYGVQVFGRVPDGNRAKGVRSLGEFLRDVRPELWPHILGIRQELRRAADVAGESGGDAYDGQMGLL